MSTLRISGEFHEGIYPKMLQLRNVFTKRLCFICGLCEEKCEANLLRISRNVRVHPGLKVRKSPSLRKRTKISFLERPLPLCLVAFEFRAPDFVFRFYDHR